MIVNGSVEERILELQGRKQALIDGALGDQALMKSSKMTQDDMKFLFGL
jgi:SNF2 family DNA or RNA helicase